MDIYKANKIEELISGNPYVGRGIIVGKTEDGKKAAAAYFIMGRSENSRNRVFVEKNGELFTEAFDASKLVDPSLIIYAAVRRFENYLIVTNGDQTDTIYDSLRSGHCLRHALKKREFEPDYPNFTPRISAVLSFEENDFSYEMSILKSADAEGTACSRFFFAYPSLPGIGHFIHTYVTDGDPIPSFQGEPERVSVPDSIDEFAQEIWNSLDDNNKVSLFVRFIDLEDGSEEERIINKNE